MTSHLVQEPLAAAAAAATAALLQEAVVKTSVSRYIALRVSNLFSRRVDRCEVLLNGVRVVIVESSLLLVVRFSQQPVDLL